MWQYDSFPMNLDLKRKCIKDRGLTLTTLELYELGASISCHFTDEQIEALS